MGASMARSLTGLEQWVRGYNDYQSLSVAERHTRGLAKACGIDYPMSDEEASGRRVERLLALLYCYGIGGDRARELAQEIIRITGP